MQALRRSDRLAISVPIRCSGIDASGNRFDESTHTLVITRHGAKIVFRRLLSLDQTFVLNCPGTNREAPARVVAKVAESSEGFLYGVEILDPEVNLWDIHFPSPADSELAAGRILLECNRCRECEVAYLNIHELEIFNVQRCVTRACRRCNDTTTWIKPSLQKLLGSTSPSSAAPLSDVAGPAVGRPARIADERKEVRLDVRIQMAVRTLRTGEVMVLAQNASEGGACFESVHPFAVGDHLEVAVPYVPNGPNVFVPARIAWGQEIPGSEGLIYGLEYIQQRRRARRVAATSSIGVAILAPGVRATGKIEDISMTGVLMKCRTEVKAGTPVRLGIEMGQETIRLAAVAKRSVPGVGTAFHFSHMGQRDRSLLRALIFKLEKVAQS